MTKKKYENQESEFLYHELCEACGSSDAKAVFSDGHTYCYSCEDWQPPKDGESKPQETTKKPSKKDGFISNGVAKELTKRDITVHTARKWNYVVGTDSKNKPVQIANYFDDNKNLVAQKVRYTNKDFLFLGDSKCPLYGQWLWDSKNYDELIIVEGEIDALSVSQVYNHRKAVVSIPKGVKGAKKDLQRNYEFVNGFKKIILAFDNDEHGKKAMEECAPMFQAGKVFLVHWSNGKDANDMLKQNDLVAITKDIKEAKEYRPDGIISGAEISLDELTEPMTLGFPYPYPRLNEMTYGSRGGELIIWTAGSGIGKSTILREISYHFVKNYEGAKVGMIFLEESVKKTAQAFIALDNNTPLSKIRHNPNVLTKEQWEKSKAELLDSGKAVFYRHFGSLDSEILLDKIRFMVVGLGVTHIFLDHISIAISGNDSDNERKDIDVLMTAMRSLVEETGCHIDAIVHLKRTSGKGSFNEGAQVSLTDLRGSGALEQLSDAVIALERNQQDGDNPNISYIRILKNREIGVVGLADTLEYSHKTGRLLPTEGSECEDLVPIKEAEGENEDF